VVATIIVTGALSPVRALTIASICEFIGPFLFGTAVANTIGTGIVDPSSFSSDSLDLSAGLIVAALLGAIAWNLLTWWLGLPSSSSHALVGGLIGAVVMAHGLEMIIWRGVLFIFVVLVISPIVGLAFGWLFFRITWFLAEKMRATPRATFFFNRMQIVSSVCLALSHGANDAQKSMGIITMSLVVMGALPSFTIPFWVIASCAGAIAAGTATGGWRIIKTMGAKIFRLRSVHAFCAQTSSAAVILSAALMGGPVSTTHVVSSSIMGAGSGQRLSAVRWNVAADIITAWFVTIPASALVSAAVFRIIKAIHPAL
jgi:PiT family inorganic phosphate transporter